MKRFTQDLKVYLRPLWERGEVVNETLMFIGEDDIGVLLYEPTSKVTVYDYRLEKKFVEGKDYRIDGRKFIRLPGSEIPCWDKADYYLPTYERYAIGVCDRICAEFGEKRYLRYGEGDTFTSKQIAVSYTHDTPWVGEIPQYKGDKLQRVLGKLEKGEDLKFLFYGDSITTGCNASGTEQGGNIPPYMPPFPILIAEYLQGRYGAKIEVINTAVGGETSAWGLKNMDERVLAYKPDLVFIAFGMNDLHREREEFTDIIKTMIERTHEALPETEIMLVSSILPNVEADDWWVANQCLFYQDLLAIEKEYAFVCTADITSMQRAILDTGKRYRDMTANNINHPNDYAQRLYAQVMLQTMLGEGFLDK